VAGRSLSLDFRAIRLPGICRTSARPYRSDRYFCKTTALSFGRWLRPWRVWFRATCRVVWIKIPWIDPWSAHEPAAGSFRGRVRQNLTSHAGKRQLAGRVVSRRPRSGTTVRDFPNTHGSWISFVRPGLRQDRYVICIDHSQSRREQLWNFVEVVRHDRVEQVRPWIRIREHHDVGNTDSF
jgi:hypothetical protein